jgi:hypothetical protein
LNVQKDVGENLKKKYYKNMKKYVKKYFNKKEKNLILNNKE